ncbi:DUF308 domain-containing protein [Listeria sp. SHR_NRA_18]|uniref:YqeB family protein n=1 Tax=Listeria sp. SHR_NRA_18 TaxID=2269046 RepID=UPI00051DD0D9|nr:hypothetical protein [Listeria sp. SHR_NRA_18]KGL41158.1 hypothetical protein EP56_11170 [Listeriaceae bacterium FSL A5-0209]RQW67493.1 DUF308 domain-containing protein [Listeria sp. SHR_NRA_18]
MHENKRTILSFSTFDKLLICLVPPIIGLILGFFIPDIAKWAVSLPWIPLKGPFELIVSIRETWIIFVTTGFGIVAGIWLSIMAFHESLMMDIGDGDVKLTISGVESIFPKARISMVFLDKKQLVLLDLENREMYREKQEMKAGKVERAFTEHGYSWQSVDPFQAEFKRWVAQTPELETGENALFAAREKALEKSDEKDARELRREIWNVGISVKEDGKKQYWRR